MGTGPEGINDVLICASLDALLTFLKSSGLWGNLNVVKEGQGGHQVSKVFLKGANELPWHRVFKNGAILDAFKTFIKSGGLRGHLKEV